MPNGPKFKVLHEFVGSRGVACRIVTEDEKKPGMMRGESWDDREQVWRQWLQSTEANVVYESSQAKVAADKAKEDADAMKDVAKRAIATEVQRRSEVEAERDRERSAKEVALAERDAERAEKESVRIELDLERAEKEAIRAERDALKAAKG